MTERDQAIARQERKAWETQARSKYAAGCVELVKKHGEDYVAALERGDFPA